MRAPPAFETASAMPKSATSVAVLEEDILRLEVSVHHALAVRVLEGAGDFAWRSSAPRPPASWCLAVQSVAEGFALHIGHHVEEVAVGPHRNRREAAGGDAAGSR